MTASDERELATFIAEQFATDAAGFGSCDFPRDLAAAIVDHWLSERDAVRDARVQAEALRGVRGLLTQEYALTEEGIGAVSPITVTLAYIDEVLDAAAIREQDTTARPEPVEWWHRYEDRPVTPAAERWRDRQGDVWTLGADGLMHSPETAPFPREHVEKKWGPLVLDVLAAEPLPLDPKPYRCHLNICDQSRHASDLGNTTRFKPRDGYEPDRAKYPGDGR